MDFYIFFGRNVTDKVDKRRFTMPPQITCASALPGKTRKQENHSYEFWHLPQDTIDNASAATAHAPYHVTYE